MKLLLLSSLFAISAFASNCFKSVDSAFLEATPTYDYHSVSTSFESFDKSLMSFDSYGIKIELGYGFEVISYQASNEYWGGLGIYEVIVNPSNCQVLKMVEVYTE